MFNKRFTRLEKLLFLLIGLFLFIDVALILYPHVYERVYLNRDRISKEIMRSKLAVFLDNFYWKNTLGIEPISGKPEWWKKVAVNQTHPGLLKTVQTAFNKYGYRNATPYSMCSESAIAMNINYLRLAEGLPPVDMDEIIHLVTSERWLYSDGSLPVAGQERLIEHYGYDVFGHPAEEIGFRGYYLKSFEIDYFLSIGYPVLIYVKIDENGLSRVKNGDVNHAILVIGKDDSEDYWILDPLPVNRKTSHHAVAPQKVSAETLYSSWFIEDEKGMGYLIHKRTNVYEVNFGF